MDPLNIPAKLKFVALPNPEIIGGTVIGRLLSK